MSSITLGQIITFIKEISVFIGAVGVISAFIGKIFMKHVKTVLEPVNSSIKDLQDDIKKNSLSQDKNFLIKCFDDIERGVELSDITKERIHETMAEYESFGGNGYVHSRYEKLIKDGKL